MLFHQLHPRRDRAAFKAKFLGQLDPHQTLYDRKHRILRSTIGNAYLAIRPYFGINAIRAEFNKKLVPIHWLKPLFNVLYMFKISHEHRVSQADSATQI
ncbi:hypothetical protein BAR1_07730 [Profundibacter amoris]|uniref:Uncharacterized protein n=1 Tax=Profundibacter amoris TaxID=2171755 RepID=A0A347UG50_9RHOB|nr:hypothetical protein BAR1_07730 [Profundibacter amoris]